jgi:hypothetical protein
MYGTQFVAILQIVTVLLCTAVAFGILLSTMLVRGRLHAIGSEGPLHDLAFTEKAYVAAAVFCAVGAIAAINMSWGSFALFLSVAGSLQLADHILLPRMRAGQAEGRAMPLTGARFRFEFLAAMCLMVIFWKTAVPPLVTLALTYGIG